MLNDFNKWKLEENVEESSVSALIANLNNLVSPNLLPDLSTMSKGDIISVFNIIYEYPIMASHIQPEDANSIRNLLINPLEKFVRVMINVLNVDDEDKEYRKTLIAHSFMNE